MEDLAGKDDILTGLHRRRRPGLGEPLPILGHAGRDIELAAQLGQRLLAGQAPYLHDGRLLTLDDTVEVFNLVLGTRLTEGEKKDLLAFLRAL
jgi:hypothetical protein